MPWSPQELEELSALAGLDISLSEAVRKVMASGSTKSFDAIEWQIRKLRGYHRIEPSQTPAPVKIGPHIATVAPVHAPKPSFSSILPASRKIRHTHRIALDGFTDQIIRMVGVWDLHHPGQINVNPLLRFIKDYAPHIVYFGGDMRDLDFVSHWNECKFKKWGYDQIFHQLEETSRDFKTLIRAFKDSAPGATFIYQIGNHEIWLEDFCVGHPQVSKPTIKSLLGEDGADIRFIPLGDFVKIGKLALAHGDQWGSRYHAARAVSECHQTICYGHAHTFMVMPEGSMVDDSDRYLGVSIPGYTPRDPVYGKGKPNLWMNGFLCASIKRSSGNFSLHPQLVSPNGHFITQSGKEYC